MPSRSFAKATSLVVSLVSLLLSVADAIGLLSFDGVGITFQLIKDTINVIEVIIDGPSEKVGILPGDKIVKVDTLNACGKSITNTWVRDHLRGKKGTKVQLGIKRGKSNELLYFTVTRGKIPMHSINVSLMIHKNTGYNMLVRFAQTSLG